MAYYPILGTIEFHRASGHLSSSPFSFPNNNFHFLFQGNPAQQLLPLAPQQMNYAGSLPPTIPHPQMANYGQQIMPSAQNQPIYLGHPMPPPTPAQPVMLPESFVNGLTSTGFFNQNWQLGATIP